MVRSVTIKSPLASRTTQVQDIGSLTLDLLDQKIAALENAQSVVAENYLDVDQRIRAAIELVGTIEFGQLLQSKVDTLVARYASVVIERVEPDLILSLQELREAVSGGDYTELSTQMLMVKPVTRLLPFEQKTYREQWSEVFDTLEAGK